MLLNHLTLISSLLMLLVMAGGWSIIRHETVRAAIPANPAEQPHSFIGTWVTADGYIQQELFADGHYEEARGNRKKAYTGRYTISGNHIKYEDDLGFTATGDFSGNDTLYHGGYVFYKSDVRFSNLALIPQP